MITYFILKFQNNQPLAIPFGESFVILSAASYAIICVCTKLRKKLDRFLSNVLFNNGTYPSKEIPFIRLGVNAVGDESNAPDHSPINLDIPWDVIVFFHHLHNNILLQMLHHDGIRTQYVVLV